jgi:membrane carboxypeptidase/penicillin-binding protein
MSHKKSANPMKTEDPELPNRRSYVLNRMLYQRQVEKENRRQTIGN